MSSKLRVLLRFLSVCCGVCVCARVEIRHCRPFAYGSDPVLRWKIQKQLDVRMLVTQYGPFRAALIQTCSATYLRMQGGLPESHH